jgi:prophage antirepressor-like protein
MTAQVVPFIFQQHYSVRVILIDNEPWFCLRDACVVLDIRNPSPERFQLDSKGVTRNVIPTDGGEQEVIFIHEPNLYRVIFRSNKPEARKFQDWIFNEVIPAIRKTGRYEVPQPTPQPRLTTEQQRVIDNLIHVISTCCHYHGKANHAAHERIRFSFGLRNSSDLQPQDFETAKADLEGLRELAEQHQTRICTLDEEFITAVIRPPVSIRKVRAMAKKQPPQSPLSF